jgi:hypothetical protein
MSVSLARCKGRRALREYLAGRLLRKGKGFSPTEETPALPAPGLRGVEGSRPFSLHSLTLVAWLGDGYERGFEQ